MRASAFLLLGLVWACSTEEVKTEATDNPSKAETDPPASKPASAASMPADHSTSSTAMTLQDVFRMPEPCPDVVATVNGRKIEKARLEAVLRTSQVQFNATRPDVAFTRFKVLDGAMHQLVERELMHELADKLGAKADPADAKAWLDDLETRMANDKSFAAFLLRAGKDHEQRKIDADEKALDVAIISKIRDQVRGELEKEAKAYYERNKKQYLEYEGREVWRLFVKAPRGMVQRDRDLAKSRAEAFHKQAKAKPTHEAFVNLVKSNSEGGKANEGGYLGWVARGTFAKDLEDQIYSAKPNAILPIYEDAHGYYIYFVGKSRPARQQPFEEVRDKILDQVFSSMIDKDIEKRIDAIRKEAKVEIFIDELIALRKEQEGKKIYQQ